MLFWIFASVVWLVAATACVSVEGPPGIELNPDGDSSSELSNDTDQSTDDFPTSGGSDDRDGDGFSPDEGDCLDVGQDAAYVNPQAIEDLGEDGMGDGVDNDCDGETDEVEAASCDCDGLGIDPWDFADAIGLCDRRFVTSATLTHTAPGAQQTGYPYVDPTSAADTVAQIGSAPCLVQQAGCEMAAMSTGPLTQTNPNTDDWQLTYMGVNCGTDVDPLPDYQGDNASVDPVAEACDRTQLTLELKAPANAQGFSFDFLFASSEYDEYVGSAFNDTFYAILVDDDLNGGATTNISFDSNGNEIEVNTNYFENTEHVCDETGSGWSPSVSGVSGSTGWLRTSWPIAPGASFTLTFSIHDEEDYSLDSMVLIDNWVWSTVPVDPETQIIPI